LPITAIAGSNKLTNHNEIEEVNSLLDEKEDETRKKKREKKESGLRKRGPYRKAHANW